MCYTYFFQAHCVAFTHNHVNQYSEITIKKIQINSIVMLSTLAYCDSLNMLYIYNLLSRYQHLIYVMVNGNL